MALQNSPSTRQELARRVFETSVSFPRNINRRIEYIISSEYELLTTCGYLSSSGVMQFGLDDLQELHDEYWDYICKGIDRNEAAQVAWNFLIPNLYQATEKAFADFAQTGDTRSASVAIKFAERLSKMVGTDAPEQIKHIGGGNVAVITLADVIEAKRKLEAEAMEKVLEEGRKESDNPATDVAMD